MWATCDLVSTQGAVWYQTVPLEGTVIPLKALWRPVGVGVGVWEMVFGSLTLPFITGPGPLSIQSSHWPQEGAGGALRW